MSDSKNLKLWNEVCEVDQDLIKRITIDGGGSLNSVASIHRIKRATEKFGTFGVNWGLRDLVHKELPLSDGGLIGILDAVLFVNVEGGLKTEFPLSSSIAIALKGDEDRLVVDVMYRKALESDLIGKGLSRLGFFADVYSDQYKGAERVADDGEKFEGINFVTVVERER